MEILSYVYWGNSIQDYILVLGFLILSSLVGRILPYLLKDSLKSFVEKTETKIDDIIFLTLERYAHLLFVLFGFWIGIEALVLPKGLQTGLDQAFNVLFIVLLAKGILFTLDNLMAEYIAKRKGAEVHLPVMRKVIHFFGWGVAGILILNYAGYNVTSLIAGLGLGGLALAMASKDYVSNLFGGVTIFVDKPFRLNDWIKIDSYEGTIEDIGFRSTRLKTPEGAIVTIPNSKFTESSIENLSVSKCRHMTVQIALSSETTETQVRAIIKKLESVLEKNKLVQKGFSVYLNNVNMSQLEIVVSCFLPIEEYLKKRSDLNLQILNVLEQK
ncbi:MAG: mechanosensitive ion channel [Alphaproteobacteria bacterium]|nr:mechanosensitive ion channel [Alphaproteobacteria bacterium]